MTRENAERLTLIALNNWKSKAREAGADVEKRKTLDNLGVLKSMMPHKVKVIDEAERTIEFVISTNAVDRDNDTLDVSGWNLTNYRRNPVILFAHDHYQPVVGRSLATWIESGQLRSRAQFTPRELNPLGFMLFQLYANDYMRATSVGFVPEEWKFVEDEGRRGGVDFLRAELIEYSAVPVPSNPEALALARSKGISTVPLARYAERVLDLQKLEIDDPRDVELKRYLETLRAVSDPDGRKFFDVLVLDDERPGRKALSARGASDLRDAATLLDEAREVIDGVLDAEDASADEDENDDAKAPRRRTRSGEHVIDLDDDGDDIDLDRLDPKAIEAVLKEVVSAEMEQHTGRVASRRVRR